MLDQLSQAIHARLAADVAFVAALPVERITTGQCRTTDPDPPFAVLEFPGCAGASTDLRANDDSSVETVAVRLKIHTGPEPDQYTAGSSITSAARACFERADFDLAADAGRVIDVLVDSPSVTQAGDDGRWTFTLEFRFKVYRT